MKQAGKPGIGQEYVIFIYISSTQVYLLFKTKTPNKKCVSHDREGNDEEMEVSTQSREVYDNLKIIKTSCFSKHMQTLPFPTLQSFLISSL
jgi:hypothetical protein